MKSGRQGSDAAPLLVTIHQEMESPFDWNEGKGAHGSVALGMKPALGRVTPPLGEDCRDGIGLVSQRAVG